MGPGSGCCGQGTGEPGCADEGNSRDPETGTRAKRKAQGRTAVSMEARPQGLPKAQARCPAGLTFKVPLLFPPTSTVILLPRENFQEGEKSRSEGTGRVPQSSASHPCPEGSFKLKQLSPPARAAVLNLWGLTLRG